MNFISFVFSYFEIIELKKTMIQIQIRANTNNWLITRPGHRGFKLHIHQIEPFDTAKFQIYTTFFCLMPQQKIKPVSEQSWGIL